jgi:hypothetical protein
MQYWKLVPRGITSLDDTLPGFLHRLDGEPGVRTAEEEHPENMPTTFS